jgi:hypothetical protein
MPQPRRTSSARWAHRATADGPLLDDPRGRRQLPPGWVHEARGVQLASAADRTAWGLDGSPTAWEIGQDAGLADQRGFADGFGFPIKAAPGPLIGFGAGRGTETFQVGGQELSAPRSWTWTCLLPIQAD